MYEGGGMEISARSADVPALKLPDIHPNSERKRTLPTMNNFDHVRKNIRIYSRGIFKAPPPYRQMVSQPPYSSSSVKLPPRHVADRLLTQYRNFCHSFGPLLHWPTFSRAVDAVYSAGTFRGVHQEWVSLFFAVLAVGTLQTTDAPSNGARPDVEGVDYLNTSQKTINTWTDELNIDQARIGLLISIFLVEMNLKSAGWVWLGAAVKIAQDIGLHCESGPWPVIEGEVRRRVWWTIFTCDR